MKTIRLNPPAPALVPQPQRDPTPFEREIDEVSAFKVGEVLRPPYRPVKRFCPECRRPHWGVTDICALCRRVT